ncbi:MAG: hypothetical protein HY053_04235 [Proteobacteria bacterium]|nr:hypothetical protein [Pseudomonadota bacterium]
MAKKSLQDMRAEMRELESKARVETANLSHLSIKLYLDAALLAHKIIKTRRPADDPTREIDPLHFVAEAWQILETFLASDPGYIRKNQKDLFPLLMAMRQADPNLYGEYALWRILGNFTVAVLDDVERTTQRVAYLEFLRDEIEPVLFRETFKARDRLQPKRMEFMEDLWNTCVLCLYELARGEGNRLVNNRLRKLEVNPVRHRDEIHLLMSMKERFTVREEEIRQMKVTRTMQSGDQAAIELFQRAQGTEIRPLPSAEPAVAPEAPQRPHFTAGTAGSKGLRHPKAMEALLKKYNPGSKPN